MVDAYAAGLGLIIAIACLACFSLGFLAGRPWSPTDLRRPRQQHPKPAPDEPPFVRRGPVPAQQVWWWW